MSRKYLNVTVPEHLVVLAPSAFTLFSLPRLDGRNSLRGVRTGRCRHTWFPLGQRPREKRFEDFSRGSEFSIIEVLVWAGTGGWDGSFLRAVCFVIPLSR